VFDLDRGRVSLGAEPHVLVPAAALVGVCHIAGAQAARELGKATGASIGKRLAQGPTGRGDASFSDAIDALAHELAWMGLGALVAERWGELLVLRLDTAPIDGSRDVDGLFSGIVEGALEAWTGRTARALVTERAHARLRILVGGPRAMARAEALLQSGLGHHEIVRSLHEDEARPSGDPGGASA
jgi:hypothetical protein